MARVALCWVNTFIDIRVGKKVDLEDCSCAINDIVQGTATSRFLVRMTRQLHGKFETCGKSSLE